MGSGHADLQVEGGDAQAPFFRGLQQDRGEDRHGALLLDDPLRAVERARELVRPDLELHLCCGTVNRGAAVLGDTVYWATTDAHLLALDAKTGRVIWDVRVEDYTAGYTSTGVPLIVKGKVVIGVAGGEFGIRGFLQAFDARTGKSLWKTYTIPAPGEPGSESWPEGSDAWRHGGGATHGFGSYDAELNVIYWGTGNPAPTFNGDVRPGDNLYTSGVLALDGDTRVIRNLLPVSGQQIEKRRLATVGIAQQRDAKQRLGHSAHDFDSPSGGDTTSTCSASKRRSAKVVLPMRTAIGSRPG